MLRQRPHTRMTDVLRTREIQACVATGDFAGAEAICADLVTAHASNAAVWQMRGDIALMAGQPTDAEAHYRWTTMLAPLSAAAWLGLARAYAASGRTALANTAATRALDLGLNNSGIIAAREIIADDLFARGSFTEGRAQLASLTSIYRDSLKSGRTDGELLRGALSAALCAGNAAFVQRILDLLYPQAGGIGPVAIAPLATLADWCAGAGVACTVIDPPRKVKLAPTTSYSRADSYKTPAVLYAQIPGGQWVPGWDYVIAPDGTVLEDTGYLKIVHVFNHLPHAYFPAARLAAHKAPAREVFVDEDVLWLSAPMHNHMGHFLIDFMPRLQGLAHAGKKLKIAVPETLTGRKFLDTLALAGVAESDLIRCAADARYRFRTLHVYRHGTSMPPHPQHVAYLHSVLRQEPTPGKNRPKRFFFSRDRIGSRLVVNTAEFQRVLDDYGFVTVDMPTLSIAEQRDLFSEAEIMLGAIGTDLFAVYFAPQGCAVVSMQWDPTWTLDAYNPQTCAMLGLRHQFFLCPETRPAKNSRSWLDLDFTVDCAALRRRLDELC